MSDHGTWNKAPNEPSRCPIEMFGTREFHTDRFVAISDQLFHAERRTVTC